MPKHKLKILAAFFVIFFRASSLVCRARDDLDGALDSDRSMTWFAA